MGWCGVKKCKPTESSVPADFIIQGRVLFRGRKYKWGGDVNTWGTIEETKQAIDLVSSSKILSYRDSRLQEILYELKKREQLSKEYTNFFFRSWHRKAPLRQEQDEKGDMP
jgi:hypothetical protein